MRLRAVLVSVLLLLISVAPARADTAVRVFVGGAEVVADAAPFILGGRTMVPLRALAERLGFDVQYDAAERKISLSKGAGTVVLWVDSTRVLVGGKESVIDVPATVQNGRTFVPVRFVSEALGAGVTWDAASQTVRVAAPQPAMSVDARALLNRVLQTQALGQPDQKMSSKMSLTVKMQGDGLPAGGMTQTMPMNLQGHFYKGDAVLTTTMSYGPLPVTTGVVLKGGKVYTRNIISGAWELAGSAPTGGGGALSSVPGMQGLGAVFAMQAEMFQQATVTDGGAATVDGVAVQKIDVVIPNSAMQSMVNQMLKALKLPVGSNALVQLNVRKFNTSMWIEPGSAFVYKSSVESDIGMTIQADGRTMTLDMMSTGEVYSVPTREPLQFPAGLPAGS